MANPTLKLLSSCLFVITLQLSSQAQIEVEDGPIHAQGVVVKGSKINDSTISNILILTTLDNKLGKRASYNLGFYYQLDDSSKISIIEQLLAYRSDTSKCDREVCEIFRNSLNKEKPKPLSKSYSIQIDALLKINSLCFGIYCNYYSPYPVLVDKNTGNEINQDFKKIEEVFEIYQEWFIRNKKKGFKNYTFPLHKHKDYSWFNSYIPKETTFDSFFRFRLPENFEDCY